MSGGNDSMKPTVEMPIVSVPTAHANAFKNRLMLT